MKGDKTTVIALIAAAVILAVVGIKSYLDYKVAELEKIHGPGAKTAPAESPPVDASVADASAEVVPSSTDDGLSEEESIDRLPRSVLPPIPEALLAEPTPAAAPAPAAPNPRSEAELNALRQENALFQERLNQIRSGNPAALPPGESGGSALSSVMETPGEPGLGPNGDAPLPPLFGPGSTGPVTGPSAESPEETAPSAPGQTAAEVADLEEQVRRQPAIAKVVDYDPEWAILVLNGGSENNIRPEMRLAVRRGVEILGFIKVTEVEPNQSIAELMSPNKFSPTARKPKPGDDIIAFNLF